MNGRYSDTAYARSLLETANFTRDINNFPLSYLDSTLAYIRTSVLVWCYHTTRKIVPGYHITCAFMIRFTMALTAVPLAAALSLRSSRRNAYYVGYTSTPLEAVYTTWYCVGTMYTTIRARKSRPQSGSRALLPKTTPPLVLYNN